MKITKTQETFAELCFNKTNAELELFKADEDLRDFYEKHKNELNK